MTTLKELDFRIIGSIVLIVLAGIIIAYLKLDTFLEIINYSERVIEVLILNKVKNKNV